MLALRSQGRIVQIPGSQLMEPHSTRYAEAWAEMPVTVQLYRAVAAHRIAKREMDLLGEWFSLDSDDGTSNVEIARRNSIPGSGNTVFPQRVRAVMHLPAGTVLNVGVAAPLFGLPGGGIQAEWIDGPYIPTRLS